jgi:hypothetical protein
MSEGRGCLISLFWNRKAHVEIMKMEAKSCYRLSMVLCRDESEAG